MNLNFKDKNLALIYMQKMLKEQYNPDVIISGDYYTNINIYYGFAHYVAKYLNTFYPPMFPDDYKEPYFPHESQGDYRTQYDFPRDITNPVSIANYFLCSNKGFKLKVPSLTNGGNIITKDENGNPITFSIGESKYIEIYNKYLSKIADENDLPLFLKYSNNPDRVFDVDERVYTLQWNTDSSTYEKQICEIDDLVYSFLIGRTIGPNSTREEIYYAQQLIIGDLNIAVQDRGLWKSNSGDLTQLIAKYQMARVNQLDTHPIIVTGYLDIYTEAALLRDGGEKNYGIHGL